MVVNLGYGRIFRNFRTLQPFILVRNATTSSSRQAEAVFVEKLMETPIIAVTDRENVDMIGPPDPVSNLRPIVRKRCLHETDLQQRLRELQDETHAWNQEFWAKHNTKFIQERKKYVKSFMVKLGEDRTLTADEMSGFYKKFLDENWKAHVNYNLQWTLIERATEIPIPKTTMTF